MNRGKKSVGWVLRILWLLLVLAPLLLWAQSPVSKRLLLKDGSYQLTSRWEIQGDRVRYFSSERQSWEELPDSLVDWKATEEYNRGRESRRDLNLSRTQQEEEEDVRAMFGPTVAPGVQLPSSGGVFLLDRYREQPQAIEMTQEAGGINRQTGRNILRAAINPIASTRQSIELKGTHARVQSHTPRPAFFLSLDTDPSAKALPLQERYRIVRAQAGKDSRVVGNLKIAITGKVSQQESFLPARVEQMPDDWIKLTPLEDLPAGEYAVIEMLSAKEMNMYVWDFGVNPAAPENPGVLRAAPKPGRKGAAEDAAGRKSLP